LIYGEDFSPERVIGFSIIWVALLIYSVEGVLVRGKKRSDALPVK
jgi:chloramphenicol-sensitive protein RarD